MEQSTFKWAFVILAMVMIYAQMAGGSEPCSFDLDNDGDVDGLDLSFFYQLPDTPPQDYSDFAGQLGKTDCLVVPAPLITFAANPEMTNGLTSATLSWNVLYADSITLEPGPGDVSAITYIDVTPAVTTEYTLTATGKGGSSHQKMTVSVDTQPPSMISSYPLNNSVVPANGADIILLGTFGDNLAGIKSVVLRDHENTDITSSALVTGSTIEYLISPTQEKTYAFTVTLEDQVGNILNYPVSFRVDNTLPVITANMGSGRYFSPLSINLAASEDAVIYYSTDGYPPFVGAGNTLSGGSPVSGIPISKTTRLQFFSVDTAGNREQTRSIDFMFNDTIAPVTGLSAIYSQPLNQVLLSWIQKPDAQSYNLYRCMNIADRVILKDSLENGYPPPETA
ncbi:MAG: chitobiase/beta-hexosaminidase C-terminal domain-containing protein [Desulfobacterium sp.]|nr:chitobiase/beta-hexosaminidase C-terminal domain-containing protein [Desulfobacterium sp.]